MRDSPTLDNINELRIWLEGKFKLVEQAQSISSEDLRNVRGRVHDLSNEVAKIVALDLSSKFEALKDHDEKLETLRNEASTAKGAIQAIKAAYGIGGTLLGAIIATALELAKVIHP